MTTYRNFFILLFALLLIAVPVLGQISFEPIRLYDEPDTQYELTDAILTPDGNLMIAWYFFTHERMGSKVHTFSPVGEPLGTPLAVLDLPIGQITCKPVSH
ncbi:hypothetical protein KKG05_05985, partial [bacterium]|nr:hypothetical protein [bacterium]